MFILSPSLQWRIAIFGFGLLLVTLPASLEFVERVVFALITVLVFFRLLNAISSAEYKPAGWVMRLDMALSTRMLIAYVFALGIVTITEKVWWSYIIAAIGVIVVASIELCFYGYQGPESENSDNVYD